MTTRTALTLAIPEIRAELKRIAFDANMHDIYHADYPYAIACSAKRQRLLAALRDLEAQRLQRPLFEDL